MNQSTFEVEVALRDVRNRGYVREIGALNAALPIPQPVYRSYYAFPAGSLTEQTPKSAINGYEGPFYLPEIILDVDAASPRQGLEKTRGLILRLKEMDVPDEWIRPFFSGTGFHVHLPDLFGIEPSERLPEIVRATYAKYFPDQDSKPLQSKGLIRLPHTVNQKSSLYKIPLFTEEIFGESIETILEWAKESRSIEWEPWDEFEPVWSEMVTTPAETKRNENEPTGQVCLTGQPRRVKIAADAYMNGVEAGARHETMQAIASVWRTQGMPMDVVVLGLYEWAQRNTAPGMREIDHDEVVRAVRDVFETPRTFSIDSPIMRQLRAEEPDGEIDIATMDDMRRLYREHITSATPGFNLRDLWPVMHDDFWVYNQEVVTVLGATGMGKSSFCQSLIADLEGMSVLHMTFENTRHLTYRRYVQIKQNMTKGAVNNALREGREDIDQGLEHILVKQSRSGFDDMVRLCANIEPDILFVDTLDKITYNGITDLYQKVTQLMPKLHDLAKELDIIVLLVSHVNRASARNGLDVYAGLGGGAIEQNSDKVLIVDGERHSPWRYLWTAKARDESPFKLRMYFDAETSFRYIPKEQVPLDGEGEPSSSGSLSTKNVSNLSRIK